MQSALLTGCYSRPWERGGGLNPSTQPSCVVSVHTLEAGCVGEEGSEGSCPDDCQIPDLADPRSPDSQIPATEK